MRTLTLILIGLAVLAACAVVARLTGGAPAAGARWFLPLWLAASLYTFTWASATASR